MVDCAFYRIRSRIYRRAFDSDISGEVIGMIKYLFFPKIGWIILHLTMIIAIFLLGYSVHF